MKKNADVNEDINNAGLMVIFDQGFFLRCSQFSAAIEIFWLWFYKLQRSFLFSRMLLEIFFKLIVQDIFIKLVDTIIIIL